MADKTITIKKVEWNTAEQFTFTSVSSSDNILIEWDVRDESTALIVLGGAADATLTVKAGAGVAGNKDKEFVCPDAEYTVIPLQSGRFKADYGANAGKVNAVVDHNCSIAVVSLGAVPVEA